MTPVERLSRGGPTIAVATFLIAAAWPALADWPTDRGDMRRSGIVSEGIELPLHQTWVHKPAHPPRPAWPEMPAKQDVYRKIYGLSPTVVFDRAFHPVVSGERLYYGSSADDAVRCLDVATGKGRWSFVTEGPVRLAPTVADGRVYAGSDDGCLYCLDAADGGLIWKHRAGPDDRRLPGNGRMISLWPVRCGVVVDDATVYFCAGLFPSQGTYLAAVDARQGKTVWKKKVDISAQGYLVASPSSLFVTTGRTQPHIYRRADGDQLAAFPGAGKQQSGFPAGGGCFALLVDDVLVHGGGEIGGVMLSDARSREKLVRASGIRLIAKGPIAYIVGKERLVALDRARYIEMSRLQQKKKKTTQEQKRIAQLLKEYLKWDVPCSAPYELIMAGDTLFAGGKNQVVAYSVGDGKLLWTGRVTGKAYSLAVSGGRLLVGTDRGTIHCFGPDAVETDSTLVAETVQSESPYPENLLYKKAAATAVNAAGTKKGFCLVLGAGTGQLAYEIARRSEFRVIGLEADAKKVAAAREILRKTGLYGSRIVIHHGRLDKLPYQQYCANLVVSDATLLSGKLPPSAEEVFRVIRPCGGVAIFGSPKGLDTEALGQWQAIPGWKTEGDAEFVGIGMVRRGPLEGAGEWTHFYADSGNSACSNDSLPPGPVDIQWFGRPGPRKMVDRHEKNIGPLYKDGRLFISGNNYIVTLDAYNGSVLWEHDLPDSIRLGAFKNCGSMVATSDLLYVAAGGHCIGFDVRSGEKRVAFPAATAAGDGKREWGYVASADDILFGSATRPGATFRIQDIPTQVLMWRDYMPVVCSDSLFALDRHSGKRLWSYAPAAGVIINPTIAIGGGRVYCIESTNPETRNVPDGRVKLDMLLDKGSNLVALDMRTGKLLWRKPAELAAIEHVIFLSYAKETLVITGTKNVRVANTEKEVVRYDLHAFDAASGKQLWNNTQVPKPDHILQGPHGEQVQHSAIVGDVIHNTGFACKLRTGEPHSGWKWQKSGKCGTTSASASCIFSRYSNPRMFNLATGEHTNLTSVTRPGCWINIIPAGGLVLIPEASSGCTCYYSIQTSLALTPRASATSNPR